MSEKEVTPEEQIMIDLLLQKKKTWMDGWDTSGAVNVNRMFDQCKSISNLSMEGWKLSDGGPLDDDS